MKKYLAKFENEAAYDVFKTSEEFVTPNVSWCVGEDKVMLNPYVEPSEPKDRLKFSSPNTFTLKTYNNRANWNGSLEYSTDGETYATWDGTEISAAENKSSYNLFVRGTGNTKITGDISNSNNYRWVLNGSDISCQGDIRSLLDYTDMENTTMSYYCYSQMFRDCTGLTTAPELPATTLGENRCYAFMFSGYTSLTTAPELPATTLATGSYANMFCSCTSLTTAPKLPATTLASECYYCMFNDCLSLTTAPELPATTLASGCYEYMFCGCTSLTTAPKLSATTLVNFCYQDMFHGCTSLNSITMLATDISAKKCLSNWVNGVAASGTFVKAASQTSLPSGISGIPSGWTVQDAS